MKEIEIVQILNNYFEKNDVIFANEIRMGIGIPDVMIGLNIPGTHENIVDYYMLKLYDFIRENNISSMPEAVQMSYMPKTNVRRYIYALNEKHILNVVDSKIEVIKAIDWDKVGTNVSIEVKVKDWKAGLFQALRYLSFSDYSYLAIAEDYLKNVDFDQFINAGVGLLSISATEIREIISPIKSKECNCFFKYISISSLLQKAEAKPIEFYTSGNVVSLWNKLHSNSLELHQ